MLYLYVKLFDQSYNEWIKEFLFTVVKLQKIRAFIFVEYGKFTNLNRTCHTFGYNYGL